MNRFQSLSVRMENGNYFIAGHAGNLFECWETTPPIPSWIFNNLDQYDESMAKIGTMTDAALPGRDRRVFDQIMYS